MNSRQAQEMLMLYRPGMDDAQDPQFAEALALIKDDPELAEWFVQHCATYVAIRGKLRQIAVPAGLKEQILSEQKAHRTNVWWRRPALLAAAAVVALLIGIASVWLQPPGQDSFSAYRRMMVRTALRTGYTMDLETNDLKQIRAYLAQRNAPADYVLPQPLEKAQGTGCVALTWHGKPVSMVCFRSGEPLGPGIKSELFLFAIDRSGVSGAPPGKAPQFTQVSKLMTAGWSQGEKVYLVAASGDESFVRKFQ
ncbi:MAG: hypothetical protein DME26_07125 [Verrucomicrobia bacterium]|nr:MAG: hypothetical protein DME26_07125 [Verrucomicrobiota bacterium]